MSRHARFHRLARRELIEAAQYYEREGRGLGAAFIAAVEVCTTEILEHPGAGLVVHSSVRRRMVRRFPYAILYAAEPDAIRVLAVMHLRRRPMYWIDRE